MALGTRRIIIDVLQQVPRAETLRFRPVLTGADDEVLLEKEYKVVTAADGTGEILLPVRSSGTIGYRYQIPKANGKASFGTFNLAAGADVNLASLIAGSPAASDTFEDYVNSVAVRYDIAQDLTGPQQSQARANVGLGSAGASFVHTQSSAATEWVVNHNLGFEPAVEVIDTGGLAGIGDIVHFSVNQLRIYFAAATAGKARCV